MPDLEEIDDELARLRSAAAGLSSTLIELEADPTWQFMRAAGLTGVTGDRGQAATAAVSELWTGHRQLTDLIAEADRTRSGIGRRASGNELAGLSEKVFGSSIELSSEAVPLVRRTLFGPTQVSTRCTPAALLAALGKAFDELRPVLADIAEAWRWQRDRLDSALAELDGLRAAGQLPRDLDRAAAAHRALCARVETDPLSVTTDDFAAVDGALARARESIAASAALRARVEDAVARAPALLAEIEQAQAAAADAYSAAVEKIDACLLGPPEPVDTAALGTQLAELTAAAGEVNWAAAAPGLLTWHRQAEAARERALADLARARRPLHDRSELRGRLDAYRAKAAAHGLAEQDQLSRMGARAHDLLHVAPCNLLAARAAVNAYVNAVIAATTRPDPRDQP
jgi:hypothetical protein